MSKKRKPNRGHPEVDVSAADHEDLVPRAHSAPLLLLPDVASAGGQGDVVDVARVGSLMPRERLAWIETTAGDWRRLPDSLFDGAFDVISMCLAKGDLFPSRVEFGVVNGNAYAELLDD